MHDVTMNRYTLTKQLGDGTYGSVVLATDTDTGETVAIKKLVFSFFVVVVSAVAYSMFPLWLQFETRLAFAIEL